jgi:hypothetical protein
LHHSPVDIRPADRRPTSSDPGAGAGRGLARVDSTRTPPVRVFLPLNRRRITGERDAHGGRTRRARLTSRCRGRPR